MIRDQVECWNATVARDAMADGRFVYAAVTTGIYCRPSCPTPTPHRRNVHFFADSAAAEAAGFCACKRCRPTHVSSFTWQIAAVDRACEILHRSERAPSLSALAAAVGVSRFHFHRIFKAMLGITPGKYASTVRWRRLAASLETGCPVAEAIYGAGYGSISRAYAKARQVLGMTPAAWRAGGAGIAVGFAVVEQADEHVLVAVTEEGVCAIELGNDPAALVARLRRHLPAAVLEELADDGPARVADAARRAELPPQAYELQPEARDIAFCARLRKSLGGTSIAGLPKSRVARPRERTGEAVRLDRTGSRPRGRRVTPTALTGGQAGPIPHCLASVATQELTVNSGAENPGSPRGLELQATMTGRDRPQGHDAVYRREEFVDETLKASFPASDPPCWTLGRTPYAPLVKPGGPAR